MCRHSHYIVAILAGGVVGRILRIRRVIFLIAAILSHQAYASPPPTAVLGAFAEEIAWLDSQLVSRNDTTILGLRFATGELADQPVILALTGVGKVNAAITTTVLIEHFRPSGVIFTGVAGSLNPDLEPGDVVVGALTVQHDLGEFRPDSVVNFGVRNPRTGERNPIFFPANSRLLSLAQEASGEAELERCSTEREPVVLIGALATGDGFITASPKKQALHRHLDADAVEMEGAAVAQVCYQLGVPCLVIRALSDRADENALQDFERYYLTAARNANRLVLEMLQRMNSEDPEGGWKLFRDERNGFGFSYPQNDSLRLLSDPRGGLISAWLKSSTGHDLIRIDFADLSSYPRDFQEANFNTFPEAAVLLERLMSDADGPDGTRYCGEIQVKRDFRNANEIAVIQLFITDISEVYATGERIEKPRGPVYAFDLEDTASRKILFFECLDGELPKADVETIVNSVKEMSSERR